MKWCRRCILPSTRPGLRFDAEGVCGACRAHEAKGRIDWEARSAAFRDLAAWARSRARGYDCVVPVSGGKDSTWQTAVCLEHGLRPLCVTWKTPARTEIGERNLENLVSLGVDHVDYRVSPPVERRFTLRAFERLGSPGIPMHMALFAIPLRLAVALGIPLVVWGENSAFEYGGEVEAFGRPMDGAWLERYGVTNGTTVRDWVAEDLSERDLAAYAAPAASEIDRARVRAIFLGDHFRWDPQRTFEAARARGFEAAAGPRTGIWAHADIDDHFISVHHWMKWYKFGFTRSFDNLSIEIRHGRMTRGEAIEALRARGDETPRDDIRRFSAFVGIDERRFFEIAERFRDRRIWTMRGGRWVIDGFLVPDWPW